MLYQITNPFELVKAKPFLLRDEHQFWYSHLGFDADGKRWLNFNDCEPAILEGTAQFFTHKFVEDSKERGLARVYIKLTELQSKIYQQHLDWIDKGNSNESVRSAIQKSAEIRINKYTDFKKNLK